MAGVPQYDQQRVSPNGPDNARFLTPDTSAFAVNGEQLQRTGAAIEQGGEVYGKIVQNEQDKANDLRVIDAENQAREAAIKLTIDKDDGYSNIRGGDVMDVNGKPLAEDYRSRYQGQLDAITGGLSNDAQRQAFARSASVLGESFYAKAKEYEAGQYQDWQQSVVKGSSELAAQEIGLHYNDPDFITQRLGSLDVSVAKLGQLQGLSGDETTALQNTARSTALTGAISSALDADDAATAQSLFDKFKDKMLAPDVGKVEGVLRRETTGQTALAIADNVFNDIPGTATAQPQFERVFSALVNQESGGNGNAVSSKGALGSTQMLPATAQDMAKKLGVQWRPDLIKGKSPEALQYQAQLGRAYLTEGLQKYGGDFYKALCYYHGGPDEAKWGSKTHAYADAILAKCGVKNGGDPSAQPVGTLDDALTAGRRMLDLAHPNASYDQIKAVEDEITHRWTAKKQSDAYADDQTASNAMLALMQNGGDIGKLPPGLRTAIPGDKWGSVIEFANRVKNQGDERDKAQDDSMYNYALTHPEVLRDASDATFLRQYAGSPFFRDVADYRARLRGDKPTGDGKNNPGNLDYATINRVVDSRLTSLGISLEDSKGHDDPATAPQVGAVRRVVNGAIAGEQRRIGRQMTDSEVESFVDRQMARPGVIQTNTIFGIPTRRTQLPLFAVGVKDIPAGDLQQIDDALDRSGQPKTDQNRLLLYYAHRTGH